MSTDFLCVCFCLLHFCAPSPPQHRIMALWSLCSNFTIVSLCVSLSTLKRHTYTCTAAYSPTETCTSAPTYSPTETCTAACSPTETCTAACSPTETCTSAPSPTETCTSAPSPTETCTSAPSPTETCTSAPSPTETCTSAPSPTETCTSAPSPTETCTSAPSPTETCISAPSPTETCRSAQSPTETCTSAHSATDFFFFSISFSSFSRHSYPVFQLQMFNSFVLKWKLTIFLEAKCIYIHQLKKKQLLYWGPPKTDYRYSETQVICLHYFG
uniref:Uncharacterized protein n=1 Tax=Esox lucius TaxID=8010 RepID=A0AAY5KPN0_ESOLU